MRAGGRLVTVDELSAGYFLRGNTMKYPDRPDAGRILQIETIDGRAGLSLWRREDLRRYPFLGVS
jgi:hypothetical protein